MSFRNRREAGRCLARELQRIEMRRPIVLALPRGGVPVGYEIAEALEVPIDILGVRKLGAPINPEYGIGAVAEDGTLVLNEQEAALVGMSSDLLQDRLKHEMEELNRRVKRYRGSRPLPSLADRTVVIVDDGVATGLTDLAAVRAVRASGAEQIVLAVPVGAPQSIERLAKEADQVVCLQTPEYLGGIGLWYEDFQQVSDDEVVSLLATAQEQNTAPETGTTVSEHLPQEVKIELDNCNLLGKLQLPEGARGLVIFAHGSGSSRNSPRNIWVAERLGRSGFATLLTDLLTEEESASRKNVFDIHLLGQRLVEITRWCLGQPKLQSLAVGYFGASTGAAAALYGAAELDDVVCSVVSRGGRPDLAGIDLGRVSAPTLLIVGGDDREVVRLNELTAQHLRCPHRLTVVPHASHLFEEPGTLEQVALLASEWFQRYLALGQEKFAEAIR